LAITAENLRAFLPALADVDSWTLALTAACDRFSISTGERLAAFLAQVAHESDEFRHLEEDLRYSAKRLMAVWPKRFTSLEMASEFAFQPERLANVVYANRIGNGAEATGDGWRYRGRGLIQLTGRSNYQAVGAALGLPLEDRPERLLEPGVAALSAAQFWQSRGLNELADHADADNDDEDFVTISVLVSGGREGLASRRAYWARARSAIL
jgi:putative chitinase